MTTKSPNAVFNRSAYICDKPKSIDPFLVALIVYVCVCGGGGRSGYSTFCEALLIVVLVWHLCHTEKGKASYFVYL